MIKLARRSVTLSFIMLMVAFFSIKPTVGEAFNSANNSQDASNEQNHEANAAHLTEEVETITNDISETPEISIEENKTSKTASKAMSFRATAYALKGRMANGSHVRRGVVAADPRVLPLGTRIHINAGAYSGTYIVADTGGAVKGRVLDIWMPSQSEAVRFGRRNISVTVLGR